jgi:hypothetical protein
LNKIDDETRNSLRAMLEEWMKNLEQNEYDIGEPYHEQPRISGDNHENSP